MSTVPRRVRRRVDALGKPVVRWGLGHFAPRTIMKLAARRGDLQGRMFAMSRGGDPFPIFDELRAAGPVYRGRLSFVATGLPAVREVLSSPDFRTGFDQSQVQGRLGRAFAWAGDTGFVGPLEPPSLLVTEPPDHTRYRRLVSRVFSVRAVETLRDRTEQIAAELLDGLESGSGSITDLVAGYCTMLPVTVITEILGVPTGERERVLAFGAAAAPSLDVGLGWREYRRVQRALAGFDGWLGDHLARLRQTPGEDLLSQLVALREDGVGLDDRELKATAGLVLAAGFETTVNLLGNGVSLLGNHPDQLDLLTADPARWPNAVDEILRYDPPVLLTGRTAIRDTTVGGVAVPRGALVTALLAAANRDAAVFTDPARFDVTRVNAKDHVAFSAGRHFCLGAALARMEGEVGLRALFDHYPQVQLVAGAQRRRTRILRGFETLPVRLGPRATALA